MSLVTRRIICTVREHHQITHRRLSLLRAFPSYKELQCPASPSFFLRRNFNRNTASFSSFGSDGTSGESGKFVKPSLLQGARVVLSNADISLSVDDVLASITSYNPTRANRCIARDGSPIDKIHVWFKSWGDADKFVTSTAQDSLEIKGVTMRSAHSAIIKQYAQTPEQERASRLVQRYLRTPLTEDGGVLVEGNEYGENDELLFSLPPEDWKEFDVGFRAPKIRHPISMPPPQDAPKITQEELFANTARNHSEVASEYDLKPTSKASGIIEAFDRIIAGDSYENVMRDMNIEIDPEVEEKFKSWEEFVISASGHYPYIPDDLATEWNIPPLSPQPPNQIAKQKRQQIQKARAEFAEEQEQKEREIPNAEELDEDVPDESIPGLEKDRLVEFTLGDWVEHIIMQDRTQKITKSGQILTYRTLVTCGNANGTGGFGMGRGATPELALKRAFREARKNLVFVERYKMFGLNYPLYGEHNNLKVYIYPLSKGMGLRAGHIIEGILEGFGISDATAKSFGKRHPYSVVRATFNALLGHEGLHEIALRRGRRLLSVHKTMMGRHHRDDPRYY